MLLGGSGGNRLQYQLNVTPFIDVMLVLLVIFMLASSAMIADMHINLPVAQSSQDRVTIQHEILDITIDSLGKVSVQSKVVAIDELSSIIVGFKGQHENPSVVINADTDVPYGYVVQVMDAIKRNGIGRVALATQYK